MNTVCTEHEWDEIKFLTYNGYPGGTITYCEKCGEQKPKSVINKQGWEDIWNEFNKIEGYRYTAIFFKKWLQENYIAPEKK